MNYNDIINKLVYELKLHDAELITIELYDKEFIFYVSCKGMGLKYYYGDIDDILLKFHLREINNISLKFDGNIIINDFNINKKDNIFSLKIDNNDFYVECLDFKIEVSSIKRDYQNKYELLDNLLKNNI